MNKLLIVSLFASFFAHAGVLQTVSADYRPESFPEYQAILAQIKALGGAFGPKGTTAVPREMSKGERAVEEAKARNRAILAERYRKEKEAEGEPQDGIEAWRKQVKETQAQWKEEVSRSLAQWKREQEIFLGRLKVYQENTFEIPVKKEKILEKKVSLEDLPEVHVVNKSFSVPIRDQRDRPTCSAFAGIRAMEILLAQNAVDRDLSEQYFYWASKPDCQKGPCSTRGSWVTPGLRHSMALEDFDLPQESDCAYQESPVIGNETQLPLRSECQKGQVKVVSYEEVKTLAEVVELLKRNTPVIMASRLTENFYRNQGLIRLSESEGKGGLDEHAKGHAFLAVGLIELPEKLREEEGNFCLLVANSWGKGWGAGGYACLTEKWLLKFRRPQAFVGISKVSVR